MAEMLVNPDDKRTKGEKIKAAGLTERTFYRWMKDERYIAYVNSLVDQFTSAELPNVWKALVRQCNLGNTAAIKLFFDMKRLNPELNDKREIERERLQIERQKLAILEAKAGGGGEDIPDDGFLEALEAKAAQVWGGEKPCP
ncbi:MAG: phBC6A51 family helix-turn-helix protein [Sporomusaceae bacterium]|nr:phBC6A51 family helix-turn-helix protein [Sporomusaceae bacterium]